MPTRRKSLDSIGPGTLANHAAEIVRRHREPKTFGKLGRPSKWLTPAEKKIWRALTRSSPAELGENDRTLMEVTVVLKAELEKRSIDARGRTELINCLKNLGIIPKERQAVKPKADEKDEWEDLG